MDKAKISRLRRIRLSPVQETLLFPCLARALESENENPSFYDPSAVEIMHKLDPEYQSLIREFPALCRLAWINRSRCMDKLADDFLKRNPGATVVNIGCGLDTTFERLKNNSVKWYDLDLPEVIEFRRGYVPELPQRKFISASFLEAKWHEEISYNKNILFIAAGVFYYFEEGTIKKFFKFLCQKYPRCELIFDATSPAGVRAANRIFQKISHKSPARLKWGLKSIRTILSWNPRIKFLGKYKSFKGPMMSMNIENRIRAWISDLLNIQYTIHLRIGLDYKRIHTPESTMK
jgi:O-methyltransferase involved in polyketide biosynthesis